MHMPHHELCMPVYHSCTHTHTNLLQPFHVYCSGACLTPKLPMYMIETHHKPCITRVLCSNCQETAVWQALQILFQPYLHVCMQWSNYTHAMVLHLNAPSFCKCEARVLCQHIYISEGRQYAFITRSGTPLSVYVLYVCICCAVDIAQCPCTDTSVETLY